MRTLSDANKQDAWRAVRTEKVNPLIDRATALTDEGTPLTLSSLRGRPVVLTALAWVSVPAANLDEEPIAPEGLTAQGTINPDPGDAIWYTGTGRVVVLPKAGAAGSAAERMTTDARLLLNVIPSPAGGA